MPVSFRAVMQTPSYMNLAQQGTSKRFIASIFLLYNDTMENVMTKTRQKDVIYALLTPTEHYANASNLPSNSSLLEP